MEQRVIFRDHYQPGKTKVTPRESRYKVISEKTGEEYWVSWDWIAEDVTKKIEKRICKVTLWKKRSGKIAQTFPWKRIYYHRFYVTESVLGNVRVDQMFQHTIRSYERYYPDQVITPLREGDLISLEMKLGFIALSTIGISFWMKYFLTNSFGMRVLDAILLLLIGSLICSSLLFWALGRKPVHPSRLETSVELEDD
ncbi:hypothetical protein HMPREF9374_2579 [Desmospora sp. 8437]|uniref:hypothetical protein n=1 Tax=Kroppenstedtia guangzhouensis TaxID=1274356 RepID=UPI00020C8D82|nr:hypothetical protein [Kroppenstedtia guangzhouensis]EGK10229.1 hypothetical protein HMPREF9374_2579 [Desmospora sp. 8437]